MYKFIEISKNSAASFTSGYNPMIQTEQSSEMSVHL